MDGQRPPGARALRARDRGAGEPATPGDRAGQGVGPTGRDPLAGHGPGGGGGPAAQARARSDRARGGSCGLRELAEGLQHAHARDVFHRDIKPANVLLQPDGAARIVDFGIAVHHGRTRLSAAGVVPGTPAYLAPEVFGGVPSPRALDVYAFGQLLYEALSGQPAFPEPEALTTTQAIAHIAGRKMQTGPLDPGEPFPEDLRAVVRRTTHPDPHQRLLDLDLVLAGFDGAPLPGGAPRTLEFDVHDVTPHDPEVGQPPAADVPTRAASRWPLLGGVAVLLGTVTLGVGMYTRPGPLDGKHIALMHMEGERQLATQIEKELLADGARVTLQIQRHSNPNEFGVVFPLGAENQALAAGLSERFSEISDARLRAVRDPTELGYDVAFWIRSTH